MRLLKIVAIILFVGIVAIGAVFTVSLGAVNAETTVKKDFVIVAGESTSAVAQRLENEGLVKNSFAFFVYMKMVGAKILPGIYELSASESATTIGTSIGSGKYKTAKLTIIEGWRVTQIAEHLTEKKLTKTADFASKAVEYEGYLFPDTYEVRIDITTEALIKLMRDNFEKKTAKLKLTPETVILASIVERESQADTDRPLVAGVYSNRVKIGMRLEADPTVQYAKGSWASITVDDYRSVQSSYNTYLNDGWPPGPIANPGLKSLEAAVAPASHDYLFFFHAKGQTHFSKTLAEHRSKVNQYF